MAKMMNCELCGKEVKKGFLGLTGDAEELDVGNLSSITVCPECYAKFEKFVEKDEQRFGRKLENMKDKYRKISKEERAELFKQYYAEAQAYDKPNTTLKKTLSYTLTTEKGAGWALFLTKESSALYTTYDELVKEWEEEKIVVKKDRIEAVADSVLSALGVDDEDESTADNREWAFSGADFSCFEYLACLPKVVTTGFIKKTAYAQVPVTIIVNDPKQMSYKPCVFHGLVSYPSGITGNNKRFAQAMDSLFATMKEDLGINPEIQAVSHKSSLM